LLESFCSVDDSGVGRRNLVKYLIAWLLGVPGILIVLWMLLGS
jgi:hypothetical protein